MSLNRAVVLDRNFVDFCRRAAGEPAEPRRAAAERLRDDTTMTGHDLLELLESQMVSRHLDLMARELRRQERGFYTIGSSGHEGNAVVGRLTRHSDPAFLHYREGALMAERARKVPGQDIIRDTLLGMMAASTDPIAGGRHKVWGSVPLAVPPQTSTIASHLPRAVGTALALHRAKRLGLRPVLGDHGEIPADSIVVCTFGDATTNHSVAQGAFNAAGYAAFQSLPVPILFVCEDNGIGISVHTPADWIEAAFSERRGLTYFAADGLDLVDAYAATQRAVEFVRARRRPAFLHLKVVRLLGHAGSDVETEYHTLEQIAAAEARDPLLRSAGLVMRSGLLTAEEVLDLYENVRRRVQATVDVIGEPPRLSSAAEVMAPLAPLDHEAVLAEAARPANPARRAETWGGEERLPERQPPRHLAVNINRALHDLLAKYAELLVFGEDVAQKGGVYHVTTGLTAKFGVGRVFNTLLDETTILGMAIGAGHLGLLPMPEIQYLAYVHNAIDQLRGEACSTQFFSNGQYRNPMVVRVGSLAYQKGFGGHFHNDNSFAALRDIPGLVVAVPARGDDAARMLRTCVALAKVNGRVVCFLEPIALYMTKDLYEPGDGLWQFAYPPPEQALPFGAGRAYDPQEDWRLDGPEAPPESGEADLTILTYGNGLYMSLRAARTLRAEHQLDARIVDLRWLSPLNEDFILAQARSTGRTLVVDEGRRSGGVSEAILALLAERCGGDVSAGRVVGHDTYIPLGAAASLVLPGEEQIVRAAAALARGAASPALAR
ncbi:MAG: MFS transporter [Phycisphaerae bacterium]|nr:MFS transporter [Phycisphaerae bacterium]MCZ2400557.1 MFS transporter [Phycisphaerae bacterium]